MSAVRSHQLPTTVVLHVGGLHYATEKAVVEQVLGRRPGVLAVDANPVAQTATVTFDPRADLGRGAAPLGRGVRLPLRRPVGARPRLRPAGRAPTHGPHDHAAVERADEAHGHGHGGHAGMSMEAMVRDMRNRFLVALVFTIPIVALVDGRHEAARHRAGDAVRDRPRRLAVRC